MKKFFLYILLAFTQNLNAQTGAAVFNDSILHELYIETDLPNWFDTLEHDFDLNIANPNIYPEIYHKCKVTFDGITLTDCGFREKGNASNTLTNFGRKKPLKISFNEFNDQELDGLKKLNLNNFTNDPSLLHDAICMKLMRNAGITASRTAYTKLWVNNEYIGLYVMIENVDKIFLKLKFGGSNNDGNLYKTDRGANVFLNWLGSDKNEYKDAGLKLTTKETADDWTKLLDFIYELNNNHAENFKDYLESHFDIHSYLKILAIEKLVRSWDSYWGGGNNYFLYEHPDGKYRWIPWDMNESFQDIKVLSGTDLLTGYLVPMNKVDERPLLKRIFEIKEYKEEYLNYCCELIHDNFSVNRLGQFAYDLHALINQAYADDPYKYNSYSSFAKSLTETNEDVVSITHSSFVLRINNPGIYPFIQSQREWAVEQMKGWDFNCSIEDNSVYELSVYPNPAVDEINVVNDPAAGFDYAQFMLVDFTGKMYRITNYDLTPGMFYNLKLPEVPGGIYLLLKKSADGRLGRTKIIIR